MPFNKEGLWVDDATYWASPEGIARQNASTAQASANISDPTGSAPVAEGEGLTLQEWREQFTSKSDASAEAKANSPEWQAALAAYNAGQPVPKKYRGYIENLQSYFKEGQAEPGKLSTELAQSAEARWTQDRQPSALDRAVDIATPLLIGGTAAAALAGVGAGAAAGGAGTATGGGLTAGQAAGTAAMAPGYVAPAIATPTAEALAGTAAAGGLTGGAGALAPAAGKIIGGSTGTTGLDPNTLASLIQGGTALVAGEIGAGAAEDATAEMRRQFDIGQQNIQPFREAQLDLLGLGKGGPEAQLSSLMASPGYQFRLQQGQKGLEASSAARGGMGSGKALTAATQYGQEYASGEYGNRLNQLAGGQTQARQDLQSGMNYAGEIGSAGLVGSQMRQSGLLGAGQAASNILNPPRVNALSDLGAYSREQEVLGAAKPKLSNLFSTGGGYRAY